MKLALYLALGLIVCLIGYCSTYEIVILHTNDVHDRFEQFEGKYGGSCSEKKSKIGECFGGVSRRLTKVREIRSKEKNVLFLDAGDQFLGTLWFNTYGGESTAYFMNNLTYDVMCLGNHEFDLGIEGLAPFLKQAKFPVVSSNVDVSREKRLQGLVKKSVVLEVGGEKFGVIGYTIPETKYISKPGDTVAFKDEIISIQEQVNILRKKGITKIIALGHSGFKKDRQIAKEVTGLDLVVGGHTNTFLYNGLPPSTEKASGPYPTVVINKSGERVLLVQDYTYGKYLGYLRLKFDNAGKITDWSGNPILLNNSIEQDTKMEREVQQWAINVSATVNVFVGHSRVELDGTREACRLRECNLGNLIADAMVQRYLGRYTNESWAEVSLAVQNSGSIRSSVDQGKVLLGSLIHVQPFRNSLVRIEIKGQQIKEAFEHSVKDYSEAQGKYLQVSGFKVVYNVKAPNGQRVSSIDVRCSDCLYPVYKPMNLEKTYSVVMPAFLANGGDGYEMFKSKRLSFLDYGDIDVDVMAEYIRQFSPVYAGLEDRITYNSPSSSNHILSSMGVLLITFVANLLY